MEKSNFKVTQNAQRPANMNGTCFFCHQSIGDYHLEDCVLIQKKVKIKLIVEYEVEVPASWDKEQIEFHRNDGSWCANNAIDELDNIYNTSNGCMCQDSEFIYLETVSDPYLSED